MYILKNVSLILLVLGLSVSHELICKIPIDSNAAVVFGSVV